jgi:hypothetical protein
MTVTKPVSGRARWFLGQQQRLLRRGVANNANDAAWRGSEDTTPVTVR